MPTIAPGDCPCSRQCKDQGAGVYLLHVSAGPSLTRDFVFLQFQKDTKDAQELLKKVDTDLDQKFSPEFKDRYQLESLLRELDVSIGARQDRRGGSSRSQCLYGTSGGTSLPVQASSPAFSVASSRTMLLPPFARPSPNSSFPSS